MGAENYDPGSDAASGSEGIGEGSYGIPLGERTGGMLGYSVVARRSYAIHFDSRGGDGSISVRLEGSCARAHPGANEFARRARVRYHICNL